MNNKLNVGECVILSQSQIVSFFFEHPVAHHNTRHVLDKLNVGECVRLSPTQQEYSQQSVPPWSIHYGCHGNCVSPSYNNVSIYIMLLISLLATNKSQNIFSITI